jgi:predicted ATPase/class 3 adenylate cyclase
MPLPSGVVTIVFTDIEGSTRLASHLGDAWLPVLQDHNRIMRDVIAAHRGYEVSTAGDSFFIVFAAAADALAATIAVQRAMAAHDWTPHAPIRVRVGVHTGEAILHGNDYAGLNVHAAARIESAAAGGQVLVSETTLAAVGHELPLDAGAVDLGMHRLKDLPSEVHIYQLTAEGLDREFPPIRTMAALRNNVPVPPSNFIGRRDALTKLHGFMDRDRLVSLIGPGGAGKTRLSLMLATERLNRYRDGVWFVEFDPAVDDETVAGAIASTLGVREEPGRSLLDSVADFVSERDVLLVLDNCEHVIDAAARCTERLLRAGSEVHVVATSREPLAIAGERVWPVPPMAINDDAPETSEAVLLLMDRVELVQPDVALSGDVLSAAVSICTQLDGLPLALELAAASAALLSLPEIAAQLDDRFGLLTRGSRTALDRQKTLWGAIDWSYELLDDDDRLLFRQLGVFAAEFDAPIVAGVLATPEPPVDDGLRRLAAKSLAVGTPTGRYRLLESIRAYAREQLAASDESDELAARHARWFAEAADGDQRSGRVSGEFDFLEVAQDDLTAAVRWATTNDGELALVLLNPLLGLSSRHGTWTEGRALADPVLAATTHLDSGARVVALSGVIGLELAQGDFAAARRCSIDYAELIGRIEGDQARQVALANLGITAARQGDVDGAEYLLTEALAVARTTSPHQVPVLLAHLAEIARGRGDLDVAWEHATTALEEADQSGAERLRLAVVNLLGDIAHQRGDLADARRYYTQALAAAHEANDLIPVPYLTYCLAVLALDEQTMDDAAGLLTAAIVLGRDTAARTDLCESLQATARWAAATGNAPLACTILSAVDGLRDAIGFARAPTDERAYNELLSALQTACGASFTSLWDDGASLPLDDVIDIALAALRGHI